MLMSSIISDYPLLMSFFSLYKISKLKINYKLYNPEECFNHKCPICLEKFTKFDKNINSLTFYGCDKLINKLFSTSIKYATNFIPSDTFLEKKDNFVFKLGNNGIGYYYDGENKFMIGDDIIKLDIIGDLPCKHAFHHHCIKKWAEKKITCPMCKQALPSDSKEKVVEIDIIV